MYEKCCKATDRTRSTLDLSLCHFSGKGKTRAGNPCARQHASQRVPALGDSLCDALLNIPYGLLKPDTLPRAMSLNSGCARAIQPAAYCLSIANQMSVEAPRSRAPSAWAITTLPLLAWVLSLQNSHRSKTNPQQRIALNEPIPTHSLK